MGYSECCSLLGLGAEYTKEDIINSYRAKKESLEAVLADGSLTFDEKLRVFEGIHKIRSAYRRLSNRSCFTDPRDSSILGGLSPNQFRVFVATRAPAPNEESPPEHTRGERTGAATRKTGALDTSDVDKEVKEAVKASGILGKSCGPACDGEAESTVGTNELTKLSDVPEDCDPSMVCPRKPLENPATGSAFSDRVAMKEASDRVAMKEGMERQSSKHLEDESEVMTQKERACTCAGVKLDVKCDCPVKRCERRFTENTASDKQEEPEDVAEKSACRAFFFCY